MKNLKPVKTVMSFNTSSKLEILSTLLSGLGSIGNSTCYNHQTFCVDIFRVIQESVSES